jgi:hypothetical protein
MRFTPDILRKHPRVLVDKETRKDRSIVAVYLRGSLLYGSPLLGGAGDIDLVFIHNIPPSQSNQIIKLTPEIHFDIEHQDQIIYQKPRMLRVDPWLGPTLRDAQPLYDPKHILDYTQAGVRSNFDFPEHILARSKPLIEASRTFWMERQINPPNEMLVEFSAFLNALEQAVNAVALLTGPPLPTRRLGSDFQERAAAAEAPGLAVAFNHLLGSISASRNDLQNWYDAWSQCLDLLSQEDRAPALLVEKKLYYQAGMKSMLSGSKPQHMLWPLLSTWTKAVSFSPRKTDSLLAWKEALTSLGFAGKDYQVRLAAFDSFLDLCETLILGENTDE